MNMAIPRGRTGRSSVRCRRITWRRRGGGAPGGGFPPILLATTRRDDRVHPGHARKMAAKLQAMGYDALFYEPAAGGHGYGKDNAEVAGFVALGFTFLRRAIGWEAGEPSAA